MSDSDKHVVIDGQILQTGAWHRGMGKYTLQLLKEMSRYAGKNEKVHFYLMLNDTLSDDAERLKILGYLCPNIDIIRLALPLPDKTAKAEDYAKSLGVQLVDKLGDVSYEFMLTSLFFFDFFAEFPDNAYRSLLFYDLTPLLFWRDLGGYFPPDLYMGRFSKILEAQTIYSISGTTKNDLVATFGIARDKVVNINGGFSRIAENAVRPTSFRVPDRFILMPTGDLPHKNNAVAVKGFAAYQQTQKKPTKLLITSHFSDESKAFLSSLSSDVVFTGNVSDEELEWLYRNASAVMFSSKYEGLGIPILDAVANNKPVITSSIPVFKEMSKDSFFYFNPDDHMDLAGQIRLALDSDDIEDRRKEYRDILKRYSWSETFTSMWKRMTNDQSAPSTDSTQTSLPRIAIVCLHPGLKNQIGRSAEPLHASLSEKYAIDYYFDANGNYYRDMERPTFLDFIADKTFDISKLTLRTYRKYDAIVYLLDDTAVPSRLMQRAAILPGLTITPQDTRNHTSEVWRLMKEHQTMKYIDEGQVVSESYDIIKSINLEISNQHSRKESIKKFVSKRTIIKKLWSTSKE